MKTTIELPDDLYRKAKAEAALSGRTVKELVEEGLRVVLKAPLKPPRKRTLAELMEKGRGIVSGPADLATNPKYMEDFGRDGRRDR